jgi:DNA-cytosine methyltransferase
MKVLSLFDGISAGQLALKQANKTVDQYYASEVDKYAIQLTQRNFPNTIQLGDVNNWREWDIPWAEIDLVMGGSPCQGFSFAGKQLNFDDPRSALFFVFVDICHHVADRNPRMRFLLENVRMKKESQSVITGYMGVEPIAINSSLVSAQNRYRLYWTNIPSVTQPDDQGIILRDILETNGDSVDPIDERMVTSDGKAYCLTARYDGAVAWNSIERKQRTMIATGNKRLDQTIEKFADQIDQDVLLDSYNKTLHRDKTPTITTRIDASNCTHIVNPNRFRKLTPVECERLQTFPDHFTDGVSKTQRYKALGNSWTVSVITHIFKNL